MRQAPGYSPIFPTYSFPKSASPLCLSHSSQCTKHCHLASPTWFSDVSFPVCEEERLSSRLQMEKASGGLSWATLLQDFFPHYFSNNWVSMASSSPSPSWRFPKAANWKWGFSLLFAPVEGSSYYRGFPFAKSKGDLMGACCGKVSCHCPIRLAPYLNSHNNKFPVGEDGKQYPSMLRIMYWLEVNVTPPLLGFENSKPGIRSWISNLIGCFFPRHLRLLPFLPS